MQKFVVHRNIIKNVTLKSDKIDLWCFPLHENLYLKQFTLNAEEQQRAQQYYTEKHRRRFSVTRTMLRFILTQYLNVEPGFLALNYGKYGKPFLIDYPDLMFNVSHSCDFALIAIGLKYQLGVDIELFSDKPYAGIAQHCFAPTEIAILTRLPFQLQRLVFFNIWTQKEAYIKACGVGLSYPTKRFTVALIPGTTIIIEDYLTKQQWNLISFMPHPTCCAALCTQNLMNTINFINLESLESVQNGDYFAN